jgi:soluble lytic murein transglycosylase-like protein
MKITDSNIAALIHKPPNTETKSANSAKDQNPDLTKLRKACRDFESIFVSYMLKSMRKATEKSDLFGEGLGTEIYTEMFDMKLADELAASGQMKIGDILFKEYAPLVESKKAEIQRKSPAAVTQPKTKADPNIAIPVEQQKQAVTSDNKVELVREVAKPDNTAAELVGPMPEIAAETKPSANTGSTIFTKFEDLITEAADKFGLNPALLKAVIKHESNGNPKAVSPDGAKGLMQLIDSTATMMGVVNPFDPVENIMGGAKYLSQLLSRFDGEIDKALASYNAGPGAVEKFNGIPPYKETRDYVKKVMATYTEENEGS